MTTSGVAHSGILWRRDRSGLELIDADGQRITVPVAEIVSDQTSEISLMPIGLQQSMTPREFADLLAYLGTLRRPPLDPATRAAMPDEVPLLEKPVAFEPIHDQEAKFHFPLWVESVPGHADHYVVLEHHPSKIWVLDRRDSPSRRTLFLDLEGKVFDGNY